MAIDVNNLVLYSSPYTVEQIDESVAAGFEAREIAQQLRTDAENGAFDGADGKGLVIEGFFATVEELINSVSTPTVGAAYGVGTAAPYDIYVWDAINSTWVNNGPLGVAGGGSGDMTGIPPHGDTGQVLKKLSDADYDAGWGEAVPDGAVTTAKIAPAAVTRAKLAQDALYSPVRMKTDGSNITIADMGYTLYTAYNTDTTITLTQADSSAFPAGAEIAFMRWGGSDANVRIAFDGVRFGLAGEPGFKTNMATKISEGYGMMAIKKFASDNTNGDAWLVTGNVEVVS